MTSFNFLKQRLDHFEAKFTSISSFADGLRYLGYKVCTLENLRGNNVITTKHRTERKGITLAQLLNEIVILNPCYCWTKEMDDIINIFPVRSILDTKIHFLNIKGKSVNLTLKDDLEIEKKGIFLFDEFIAENDALVNLSLESTNLREVLNAIVIQLGQTIWHITGNPGEYFLTISSINYR